MIYLLQHTVQQSAQRFPNKLAFKCGNRTLTYSELLKKSQSLAASLIQQGIAKGDRVGIIMNRSIDTAVAMYGIMMAGGAYVPIDPRSPISRIEFILSDCDIAYLVTSPSQSKVVAKISKEINLRLILGLETHDLFNTISWDDIFKTCSMQPKCRILADDLAYIIYTSGSTGTPKGIMHTHRSGLSYAKLTAHHYELNENDIFGNHSPIHFDISNLGYYTSPLVGGTTIITPEAYTKMPASMTSLIEKEKVTIWYSVPLALVQMLEMGALETRDFSALKWVLFAGEVLATKHLRSLFEKIPQTKFSNVYGPAEVNQCTYYDMSEPPMANTPIPIGSVWENSEGLLVDDSDEPVLDGEVGELLIRSATMMTGYWKQPNLTKESILLKQSHTGIVERFYRSGDLMKCENGNLHFLGRKDRQIKIRGYRVELDEIASIFDRYEGIAETAVFSYKIDEQTLIAAYVILKNQFGETNIEFLRSFIESYLPPYACPSAIRVVDNLPRTSTEKIDYEKLRVEATKEKIDD